jgi:PAS domain S-box-containing protein
VVRKSTWGLLDDGVFWKSEPVGVVAARVAADGPGGRAGVRPGDVLLAIDGVEVLGPAQVQEQLGARDPGARLAYALLRSDERRSLELAITPLPQGHLELFYYLAAVGFFSLLVGTVVALRRPHDRAAWHLYALCALFFLVYTLSHTGRLDGADWTVFWLDRLAALFLPAAFLHFCLTFPERRPARAWLVAAAYVPACTLAGASVAGHVLFLASGEDVLWRILAGIDRIQPLHFGLFLVLAFVALRRSYREARTVTVRRQMKWLVWGTGAGVLPFLFLYAVPFALGREPRLALELAGYVPLALIPLSLAYAVVKHRLMDVELIFRRTLVTTLALGSIVALSLLVVGLFNALPGDEEPHVARIAVLSALVVTLLFSPLKSRIQEGIDRLFLRERYNSRRALLRLSQDLNADLDLGRTAERLLDGVTQALGVDGMAVLLPGRDGDFEVYASRGRSGSAARVPCDGALVARLGDGRPLNVEHSVEVFPEVEELGYASYFPCRVKGEVIAVLALGRKDNQDPLNSEELDLVQALAGQAATAFMNGRLYESLRVKAEEAQRLTEYSENILESVDAGILVLDLEGRIARWNRALEALDGRSRQEVLGRTLDEVFPPAFMEALRGSLVVGRQDEAEIAHIYKLHLPASEGRALMVNVSVAPFELGAGHRAGTILILDDVTTRIRLEEQLQHAEKMASIGILAAGVAHEVNTPLAGIASYTQLLRGRIDDNDPRLELLDKIEKQSFRAAKIVNSLLNFSRSSGTEFETLSLNKVLLDVLSLVDHQLEGARIRVRRELSEDIPAVRGNENRLQQVFFNLILNARDAMPRGGWLTILTRAEEDGVVVEVRDTGEGIKRENIKRIYDPFFTTKGMGRGTGLGLAVSYGILQEHGGAIFVESTPGQGTSFRIVLPALRLAVAAQR